MVIVQRGKYAVAQALLHTRPVEVRVWNAMVHRPGVQMERSVQGVYVVVQRQRLISRGRLVYSVQPIVIAHLVNFAGIINVLHRPQCILAPIQLLVILVKEVHHVLKIALLKPP